MSFPDGDQGRERGPDLLLETQSSAQASGCATLREPDREVAPTEAAAVGLCGLAPGESSGVLRVGEPIVASTSAASRPTWIRRAQRPRDEPSIVDRTTLLAGWMIWG